MVIGMWSWSWSVTWSELPGAGRRWHPSRPVPAARRQWSPRGDAPPGPSEPPSLGARAATVNEADLAKATPDALLQVVAYQVRDVPRRKGVEVQRVVDRQDDRRTPRPRPGRERPSVVRIGPTERHRRLPTVSRPAAAGDREAGSPPRRLAPAGAAWPRRTAVPRVADRWAGRLAVRPQGTDSAGCPVRLIGRVQRVSQARTSSVTPSTVDLPLLDAGRRDGRRRQQQGVHAPSGRRPPRPGGPGGRAAPSGTGWPGRTDQ